MSAKVCHGWRTNSHPTPAKLLLQGKAQLLCPKPTPSPLSFLPCAYCFYFNPQHTPCPSKSCPHLRCSRRWCMPLPGHLSLALQGSNHAHNQHANVMLPYQCSCMCGLRQCTAQVADAEQGWLLACLPVTLRAKICTGSPFTPSSILPATTTGRSLNTLRRRNWAPRYVPALNCMHANVHMHACLPVAHLAAAFNRAATPAAGLIAYVFNRSHGRSC